MPSQSDRSPPKRPSTIDSQPNRDSPIGEAKSPLVWRFLIYGILLGSCLLSMTGRLWLTQKKVGDVATPLLSANDKSRWVSVRALHETGGYEIERYTQDPITGRFWNTIDKVVHEGRDGRIHEYSSKPPLLATMFAVGFECLHRVTAWTFEDHLFSVVQTLLWFGQILPLTLTLAAFAWCIDRLNFSQAAKYFVFATACWGTFVTTFAVSLNNHHFAVIAAYWSLIALLEICRGQASHFWFVVLGFAGAFAAANELPALAWTAMVLAMAACLDIRRTFTATIPAMLIVALAAVGTLLIAHQSLRPPYAHRSDGAVVTELEATVVGELQPGPLPVELRRELNRHAEQWNLLANNDPQPAWTLGPSTMVEANRFPLPAAVAQRWVIRDYYQLPWSVGQWRALVLVQQQGESHWEVRTWDNWYDYPGSYWHLDVRGGVDAGEASPAWYAFHCLIGHHGIFSLTPVWLLSVWGIMLALVGWVPPEAGAEQKLPFTRIVAGSRGWWRVIGAGVLLLSVVVVGFYLLRPLGDRNYGGQTSVLRWLLWLSPFWLLVMLPAAHGLMRHSWGRYLAWILLIASAASALYSGTNPWVHPWLYYWWVGPEV